MQLEERILGCRLKHKGYNLFLLNKSFGLDLCIFGEHVAKGVSIPFTNRGPWKVYTITREW